MKTTSIILATMILSTGALAQQRTVRTTTTTITKTTTPAYSFASNTQHEVVISPTQVSIESYKQQKSRTDITIYGAYNHHLQDYIQIGGEGGMLPGTDSDGDSKMMMAAMGVFTWNFDSNLREAFFVQGGVGLYPAYDKDDRDMDSKISFFAGSGKRFEVWGKINYMPYLRLWKRGDENTRVEIQALNFSIFY